MKRKTKTFRRSLATACLLTFGTTILGIGASSLDAQGPSPLDTCSRHNTGSVCLTGEYCLLFFCLAWETYWPETGEPEE